MNKRLFERMGKLLHCHWWVRDLTLFEALFSGTFDHLNCQVNIQGIFLLGGEEGEGWGRVGGMGSFEWYKKLIRG